MLRTKVGSRTVDSERMNALPLATWDGLPRFDRPERALVLAEYAAFVPAGFLRWLNCFRPAGDRAPVKIPLPADGVAAATDNLYRERVRWWCG
jgi:hypothetical protein